MDKELWEAWRLSSGTQAFRGLLTERLRKMEEGLVNAANWDAFKEEVGRIRECHSIINLLDEVGEEEEG